MFGGLGIQGNPYGSLMRNVLECSFAEEGKGAGKSIFGEGFKSSSSEARKKLDITYPEYRREIGE